MGKQGDKLTVDAGETCARFVNNVAPLGEVTSKKMFGGYGIFEGGKMFALVNSDGELFLKVDDRNRPAFEEAASEKHGRMPYYQLPASVSDDQDLLLEWTATAIEVSKEVKK